jgi:Calcineurin-like phosphoesterase
MQTITIDRDQAIREIAAVERALEEGFPPPPLPKGGNKEVKGAVTIAAERLGVSPRTLANRIGTDRLPGSLKRYFGLEVDWSKYKPLPPSNSPELPADEPSDPIVVRRLRDENANLRAALKLAERRAAEAEDIRIGVLGLRDLPPTPIKFPSPGRSDGKAETAVLVLSDLHWGEVVDLDAMDGLNSYDLAIARKRMGRWTNGVCDLLTKHWSGLPPERIILILGGDLVSGGIHHELAKTDALRPLPAVRDVADHLRHAILTIKANVKCPIDIISLPGNHGRSTLKPESKEVAATSHDVLVSDFLEMGLRDQKGITFFAPVSPDALFSVYGWRVLASHGDKIGSRGGQGFIGPAATAARGLKRMVADYAARGIHVDLITICHFHTPLLLEEGFVNGSLPGPTEYARDGRFRPHPAMQLMFAMHPRRKVSQIRWIEVGHPDEGSLYEPPPPDRPLRPRYRVKAVTQRVP